MSARESAPPGEGKYVPGGDLLHGREGAPPQMGIEVTDLDGDPIADRGEGEPDVGWLQRARDAYEFSTSYVDSNYRKKWEDGIRAFNNQHPLDSKYSSPNYAKRSNLYRPKTRAVIRKNEAAASAAFFANPDAITCEANNQADKMQQASAEVMKQLIQYRLEKSIPWYLTCIGGLQDAQTTGACAGHVYWEYDAENGIDRPCVDLKPIENIRIDPGADWRDPAQSSPYLIELIPMYIGDVRSRMSRVDEKTGAPVWKSYGLGVIRSAMQSNSDSTRVTRNKDRQDPLANDAQPVSDYEVVWVHRHIHRYEGRDWTFYTLADMVMLTDPVPLKDVVHHGKRPYVLGCAIMETHKIMSSGVPEISAGLQRESNELGNTFLDNVYFVLNKKWLVKRGQNTDLPSLVRNTPGGVTLTNNPEEDIKEINWPDITPSSAQAQDRLNADFADLTGDFSANQAQIARKGNEPGKIMALMAQAGNPLTEYLLRTYVVTFVEPVMRQLVLLEQEYETDATILAIAGQKAQLQKFGVDSVTDEMLRAQMTIRVNVGMGATDPFQKLQKFLMGVTQFKDIALQPPPGLSLNETAKEIFGLLGYQDGGRFFDDQDPEKAQFKAQLQHAGQVIQELGKRIEDKDKELASKAQIAHEGNVTQLLTTAMKDPLVSHAVVRQLGPGQGFSVPNVVMAVEEHAQKERMATEDRAQGEKIAKEKEMKDGDKIVESIGGMAKMHQEASQANAQTMAQIVQAMMQATQSMVEASERNAQAMVMVAQALAAPKVKETQAVKDAQGGFTMRTTEHSATRQ